MGLRSWLLARLKHAFARDGHPGPSPQSSAHRASAAPAIPELAPGCPATDWEEVPAYLPVDPAEHRIACVIASAIAAGDHPESKMAVRSLSIANPEHRRVAAIAAALGAGALEQSSFTVKKIYRKKVLEETHAA